MKSNNDLNKEQHKVLIVDDIPENLQVLSSILHEKGIEISFATNGEQALESVRYNKPDLILLDIAMPGMDGFEVCKILKSEKETYDIPVIFLTARTGSEDIIKGFEAGAIDFVTKPFNAKELTTRVFTHIELKKSKDTISTQNLQLKKLNQTKDKLLSIVAHDLKNPFNALIGFAEMLIERDDIPPQQLKKFHQYILQAAQQGYSLLENLLSWSRNQMNALKWQPEYIPTNTLINDIIEQYASIAKIKGIKLKSKTKNNYRVFADKRMVTIVLRNLVANALKFTPEGGEIILDTIPANNSIAFSVSDTGVGIAPEEQKKLFNADIHYSTTGTNNESGTGLGLLLCKEFVERNSGTISVESTENSGSRFTFNLPLAPP